MNSKHKKGIQCRNGSMPMIKPEFAQQLKTSPNINKQKEEQLQQDQEYESFKYYDEKFSKVLTSLQFFQNKENLAKAQEQQIKDLCNVVTVLVFDWNQQSEDNQQVFFRETLLQGMISILLSVESARLKVRIIRQCLQIFKQIGLENIFKDKFEDETIITPNEFYNLFLTVIKEGQHLSKDQTNDKIILEDNLTQAYFDIVASFDEFISIKFLDEKVLSIFLSLFKFLKNCAVSEMIRKKHLEKKNLELVVKYLHFFEVDDYNMKFHIEQIYQLYITITGLLRNLATEVGAISSFIETNTFHKLTMSIELYSDNYQLVLNTMRVLSKLSMSQECSAEIFKNKKCLQQITLFFKIYQTDIYLIIRSAFVLANISILVQDLRKQIYFEFQLFNDLFACFEYFFLQNYQKLDQKQQQQEKNNLAISQACWDFKILQKESDNEALIKIIRLISYLLADQEIGMDIINKSNDLYYELLGKLSELLVYNNIEDHIELIIAGLNCLANAYYYISFEKQLDQENQEKIHNRNFETLQVIGQYVMQSQNDEVCTEALRVIQSLVSKSDIMDQFIDSSYLQAMELLLQSSQTEIIIKTLQVFRQLMSNEQIRQKYGERIIDIIILILFDDNNDQENDQEVLYAESYKFIEKLIQQSKPQEAVNIISKVDNQVTETYQQCQFIKDYSIWQQQNENIPNQEKVSKFVKILQELQSLFLQNCYTCQILS